MPVLSQASWEVGKYINKGISFFLVKCQPTVGYSTVASEPVNFLSPYFLLALQELSWAFVSSSGISGLVS